MNTATLKVYRTAIDTEVQKTAALVAAKRGADAAAYSRIGASAPEATFYDRFVQEAVADIATVAGDNLVSAKQENETVITPEGAGVPLDPLTTPVLAFTLRKPKLAAYSEAVAADVLLHFIANSVLAKWFAIVLPDCAEQWAAQRDASLQEFRSLLSVRSRPTRTAPTPAQGQKPITIE